MNQTQVQLKITPELLKEYRCEQCGKLLCKGFLRDYESTLEVKCRRCGILCSFHGPDAEIIKKRAVYIREGLIPDSEMGQVD